MAFSLSSTAPHSPLSLDAEKIEQKRMWQKVREFFSRDEQSPCPDPKQEQDGPKPSLGRRLSRRVVPGLPRPPTFKRQQSERRERLTPVKQSCNERRTASVDHRRAMSARPASPVDPKRSAPAVYSFDEERLPLSTENSRDEHPGRPSDVENPSLNRPEPPPSPPPEDPSPVLDDPQDDEMDELIKRELEDKWILNLSMHFRDRSPREKFFITYAQTPTRWRRVTVSCDYRDSPPDSLEQDLQALPYQRDKNARIYEAIRTSLPDIQFYDTVTNLKLETSHDDRLHVHVTEDVNEIIPYPAVHLVQHIRCNRYPERDVKFDSHMSGFVYKVQVHGRVCIKKEIPGPDSVEEFLYEINALHSLIGAQNVIQLEGLVVDDDNGVVKGLLIGYAEQGPLVDIIYDFKGKLALERREKWAWQIVNGLSEIHEAGFVQGDFTLSNIVIDQKDDAKIIDINRRGCPVGWEPPEIARMIESGQRISMYIGVKSDLFQLGMVLWGLAEEEDEPERQPRPLSLDATTQPMPLYYCDVTSICLSEQPRDRLSAQQLLHHFPNASPQTPSIPSAPRLTTVQERDRNQVMLSEPKFVNGIGAEAPRDVEFHTIRHEHHSRESSLPPYTNRHSSIDIPFDGPGSYMVSRGRSPNVRPRAYSPYNARYSRSRSAYEPHIISVSPSGEHRWEEIGVDGHGDIVEHDLVDSEDEMEGPMQRRLRRVPRDRLVDEDYGRPIDHIDSGLADMDLVGVGGNDMLKDYHELNGEERFQEFTDTQDSEKPTPLAEPDREVPVPSEFNEQRHGLASAEAREPNPPICEPMKEDQIKEQQDSCSILTTESPKIDRPNAEQEHEPTVPPSIDDKITSSVAAPAEQRHEIIPEVSTEEAREISGYDAEQPEGAVSWAHERIEAKFPWQWHNEPSNTEYERVVPVPVESSSDHTQPVQEQQLDAVPQREPENQQELDLLHEKVNLPAATMITPDFTQDVLSLEVNQTRDQIRNEYCDGYNLDEVSPQDPEIPLWKTAPSSALLRQAMHQITWEPEEQSGCQTPWDNEPPKRRFSLEYRPRKRPSQEAQRPLNHVFSMPHLQAGQTAPKSDKRLERSQTKLQSQQSHPRLNSVLECHPQLPSHSDGTIHSPNSALESCVSICDQPQRQEDVSHSNNCPKDISKPEEHNPAPFENEPQYRRFPWEWAQNQVGAFSEASPPQKLSSTSATHVTESSQQQPSTHPKKLKLASPPHHLPSESRQCQTPLTPHPKERRTSGKTEKQDTPPGASHSTTETQRRGSQSPLSNEQQRQYLVPLENERQRQQIPPDNKSQREEPAHSENRQIPSSWSFYQQQPISSDQLQHSQEQFRQR